LQSLREWTALKQGGTAADAAATVALTQVTTRAGSYSSIAGILKLLYYEAKTGKVYSLNAGYHSYLNEPIPRQFPSASGIGSLAGKLPEGPVPEGEKLMVSRILARD